MSKRPRHLFTAFPLALLALVPLAGGGALALEPIPPALPGATTLSSGACQSNPMTIPRAKELELYPGGQCGRGLLENVSFCGGSGSVTPCNLLYLKELPLENSFGPGMVGRRDPSGGYIGFSEISGGVGPVLLEYGGGAFSLSTYPAHMSIVPGGVLGGQSLSIPIAEVTSDGTNSELEELWARDPVYGWSCLASLPDLAPYTHSSLRRDRSGCIYGAGHGQGIVRSTYDGQWSFSPIPDPLGVGQAFVHRKPHTAIGPTGVPQSIFQVSTSGPITNSADIYWQMGNGAVEGPLPVQSQYGILSFEVAAGGTDPDEGIPTIVLGHDAKTVNGVSDTTLTLMRRLGGTWDAKSIQTINTTTYEDCLGEHPPTAPVVCNLFRTRTRPHGIAVSENGEVRYVFSRVVAYGQWDRYCYEEMGETYCVYEEGDTYYRGSLYVGWLDGNGDFEYQGIPGVFPNEPKDGNAVVLDDGSIHVGYWDAIENPNNPLNPGHHVLVGIK